MNWSDYEAVWKRQPLPQGASADLADLRDSFEAKRRKLAATLQVRDWTELAACGVVIAAYIHFWRKLGTAGWPMGGAILLILSVAVLFVRERRRIRRLRLGANAPLLAKVEADLAELRHQRHLLRNLWAWYLGPCAGAFAIHFLVILFHRRPWGMTPAETVPWVIAFWVAGGIVLLVGTCWFVWFINQRALKKNIQPRIAELEKLRDGLCSTPDSTTP